MTVSDLPSVRWLSASSRLSCIRPLGGRFVPTRCRPSLSPSFTSICSVLARLWDRLGLT